MSEFKLKLDKVGEFNLKMGKVLAYKKYEGDPYYTLCKEYNGEFSQKRCDTIEFLSTGYDECFHDRIFDDDPKSGRSFFIVDKESILLTKVVKNEEG